MSIRFKTLLSLLAIVFSFELGATGPNGTPGTSAQKAAAHALYRTNRVPYQHPQAAGQSHATPPQSTASLNHMASSLHASMPTQRARNGTTTGVSQIAETGQLVATSSQRGAMPPQIREHIDVANTLVQLGNPLAQPMIAAPNVLNTHAEGAGEHFAAAHGGYTIAAQGSSRPACLSCQRRQDSQGISREPNYTTGQPTEHWSSPDLNPQRAAQENQEHEQDWANR